MIIDLDDMGLISDGTFSRCHCSVCKFLAFNYKSKTYFLCHSPFVLYIDRNNLFVWENRGAVFSRCSYASNKQISFFEVFDEIPEHLQEKLVFHLDVFSKT